MANPFEFKNNLPELVDGKVLRRVGLTNEILQEFRIPFVLENGSYKFIQDDIKDRLDYLLSVSSSSNSVLPGEIKVVSSSHVGLEESAPSNSQEVLDSPDSPHN